MEQKTRRAGLGDLLLLVFSLLYLSGILTFFAPCGPKEDGSWMTCHWAGQAALGTAAVLTVLSVVHILAKDRGIKLGLDVGILSAAALSALIPGRLIGLCMMPEMRCRQLTAPGVTVCSVLILAAAAADLILQRERRKRDAL